ncbi:MAG TPA: methyltransferase [Vicinamibacterales bacterium]|nr:methyltransferase [Vicinamibacterales bacterium]
MEELRLQVLGMMMSGILAQSLAVAAELGIADLLADGPKSAAELASKVHVQPDKLRRLLRYAASHGVFRDTGDGRFALTPLGEVLRSDSPDSVRAAGQMIGRASRAYPFLLENLRTGTCGYNLAFGKPIFEDLSENPHEAAIFDTAMKSFHGGETEAMLNAYSLDGVGTICDIGAGSGVMMVAMLERYPSMQGVLFDLDHVLERTRGTIEAAGLATRCRCEVGSFFETIPAGADVYTIRHIIHDWQDDESIRILSNVHQAMKTGSKLLVLEAVVPEGNEPHFSKMADMAMMLWPHGLERTADEFRALLAASGFELVGITPTLSPVSVIEARPKR